MKFVPEVGWYHAKWVTSSIGSSSTVMVTTHIIVIVFWSCCLSASEGKRLDNHYH